MPARWDCIACGELGVAERPGLEHNPRVIDCAAFSALDLLGQGDELPWVGLFAAWVVGQSGVARSQLPENPLLARAWLGFGTATNSPQPGDVAVFQTGNPSSGAGSVGFYVGSDDDTIEIIMGDLRNNVGFAKLLRDRLLGFRTLSSGG